MNCKFYQKQSSLRRLLCVQDMDNSKKFRRILLLLYICRRLSICTYSRFRRLRRRNIL
nr:MAG TPA: hypothetical protein [Bacteriophage sp.]